MLHSTIRFGTLLFKCFDTFFHNQDCRAFLYPDRFACYIPPFVLVPYCLNALIRFFITKIVMRLCTRTVCMLNSTICFGTLLFKCFDTFFHNQDCHAFLYPDRFACYIPPFVLVPYCLNALVRFCITKIVVRLCTRTVLHATFHHLFWYPIV